MFFLRFIFILIGLSFLVINSSAQKKLASVTTISTAYDENNIKVDTTLEYYKNGVVENKYVSRKLFIPYKIDTIENVKKLLHIRVYRQTYDSEEIKITDELKIKTKNEILILKIRDNDTFSNITIYKKPILIISSNRKTLKKNSFLYTRSLVINNHDTTIEDYNHFLKITKEYSYNTEKNEWYISDKSFYRNAFCIVMLEEIRYNRFTKKYIKTIRKRRKNTEKTYSTNPRHLILKKKYLFKYF